MKIKFLLILPLFLICFQTLSAQWQKVDLGINVSSVSTPVIKLSNGVVAGTASKLYYKLDSDTVWSPIESSEYGLRRLWYKIKATNDTLVAFSSTIKNEKNPIFVSTNRGMNWSEIEPLQPENPRPNDIIFDADTLYMVGNPAGIYATSDLGLSWRKYNNPYKERVFHFVSKIGHRIFAARPPVGAFDTSFTGVARTTDYGENWTNVSNGLNPYVTFLKAKDTILYAGTYSGLFFSKNYGDEWSPVVGLPGAYTQFFDYEGSTLVVSVNNQIYLSIDNGDSWSNISEEIFAELNNRNIGIIGLSLRKGVIYISTSRGVFTTSNRGINWKIERFEGANPTVLSFTAFDSKIFAGTLNFGILKSQNNGKTWIRIDSNFSENVSATPSVSVLKIIDSTIYAIPYTSSYFYMADLETMQWKMISKGLPATGWSRNVIKYKDTYFLSHTNGLFYSNDSSSWTQNEDFFGGVFSLSISSDTLFASTQKGDIMFTTDGISWAIHRAVPYGNALNFWKNGYYEVLTGSHIVVGSTTDYSLFSSNGGMTWDSLDYAVSDVFFNGTEILVSFEGKGIATSNDAGKSWVFKNDGLNELDITNLYGFAVLGDTIFAYGGSSIYKDALRNYITTSVQEEQEFVQNYFYYYPPYPLPTSDQTKVNVYWGPDVELTAESIEIFSVLGEKVSHSKDISIVKQTTSNGIITWNCRAMPPGAYVMKVQHGDKTSAIKIMLAK